MLASRLPSHKLRPRGWIAFAVAAAAVVAAFVDGAATAAVTPVIPPGREEQVLELAGGHRIFPGGCTLDSARIDNRIDLRYACASGQVQVVLAHPAADPSGIRTDRFAVSFPGDQPPAGFAPALLANIRSAETSWTWRIPTDSIPGDPIPGAAFALVSVSVGPRGVAVVTLMAVLLLLTAVLRIVLGRTARIAPGPLRARDAAACAALALASVAFVWRLRLGHPAESIEHLRFAIDCSAMGTCRDGLTITFSELRHGSLWVRMIQLVRSLGLGVEGMQRTLMASQGLAVAAFWLAARRHLDHRFIWTATALFFVQSYFVAWNMAESNGLLSNPELVPLSAALLLLLLFECLARERPVVAIACGVALGLFADLHTLSLPAVVTVPIALLALGRRPLRAILVMVVALGTMFVVSSGAHLHNLSVMLRSGHVPLLLVGTAIAVAAAALIRRFTRPLDGATRCAIALLWLFATSACLPILMLATRGTSWGSRYWGPPVATCGLVAAMALQLVAAPLRRTRAVETLDLLIAAALLVALAAGRLPV